MREPEEDADGTDPETLPDEKKGDTPAVQRCRAAAWRAGPPPMPADTRAKADDDSAPENKGSKKKRSKSAWPFPAFAKPNRRPYAWCALRGEAHPGL